MQKGITLVIFCFQNGKLGNIEKFTARTLEDIVEKVFNKQCFKIFFNYINIL